MEKNNDLLYKDLTKAMYACERGLLKELFPEGELPLPPSLSPSYHWISGVCHWNGMVEWKTFDPYGNGLVEAAVQRRLKRAIREPPASLTGPQGAVTGPSSSSVNRHGPSEYFKLAARVLNCQEYSLQPI